MRGSMAHQAGGIVDFQLVHQLLPVLFDRLDTQAQFARDLLIGVSFSDELQHLGFAQAARGRAFSCCSTTLALVQVFPG